MAPARSDKWRAPAQINGQPLGKLVKDSPRLEMLRSKGVAATIHAIAPISVLTFWLFRSSSHLLSHDVAWFLFGSERMVDGASLYRDVIDVNPPLVFYLGVPAAWLQHALGWSDIVLYRLGVLAAIVLSLWLCNHFSRVLLAEFVPATHRHLTMLLAVLLTTRSL